MQRQPLRGKIVPKISTMPRQQSESAAFLDIYKLTIEKKRLQTELQSIDRRRQQILDHLTTLETQVDHLEQRIQTLRSTDAPITDDPITKHPEPTVANPTSHFDTLFLEY